MKKSIVLPVLVSAFTLACTSCSKPRGPKPPQERTAVYQIKDSTLEGYCGSRTNADTLDIVPVGYDPVLLDMHEARLGGRILGCFDVGDKVKVMLVGKGKTTVKGALDFTTLCKKWIQRDSTSDLPYNVGLELNMDGTVQMSNMRKAMERLKALQERKEQLKGGGDDIGAENQNPMAAFHIKRYSKWSMSQGYLILTQENMFGKTARVSSDTAAICLLQRDSLVLKTPGGAVFGILTHETAAEAKSSEK
jgi:hypothetical protein